MPYPFRGVVVTITVVVLATVVVVTITVVVLATVVFETATIVVLATVIVVTVTVVVLATVAPPRECLLTSEGYEYKGHVNITKTGRTCQTWALQTV